MPVGAPSHRQVSRKLSIKTPPISSGGVSIPEEIKQIKKRE
jgi:hypothetical protein